MRRKEGEGYKKEKKNGLSFVLGREGSLSFQFRKGKEGSSFTQGGDHPKAPWLSLFCFRFISCMYEFIMLSEKLMSLVVMICLLH